MRSSTGLVRDDRERDGATLPSVNATKGLAHGVTDRTPEQLFSTVSGPSAPLLLPPASAPPRSRALSPPDLFEATSRSPRVPQAILTPSASGVAINNSEQSTPQASSQVVDMFMPQHAGRQAACGRAAQVWMCCLVLCMLASGTIFGMYGTCFVMRGKACHMFLPGLQRYSDASDRQLRQQYLLGFTCVFVVATVVLAWSSRELTGCFLNWRRTRRLRRRIVDAMGGVTSRTDATRKLMSGLRSVMELVHDSSLQVRLTFEGLSYRLRDGTYVLSDASGVVEPDEITVVMGPSGCGKSTLLCVLSASPDPNPKVDPDPNPDPNPDPTQASRRSSPCSPASSSRPTACFA